MLIVSPLISPPPRPPSRPPKPCLVTPAACAPQVDLLKARTGAEVMAMLLSSERVCVACRPVLMVMLLVGGGSVSRCVPGCVSERASDGFLSSSLE
jgi:hypothetical protein